MTKMILLFGHQFPNHGSSIFCQIISLDCYLCSPCLDGLTIKESLTRDAKLLSVEMGKGTKHSDL